MWPFNKKQKKPCSHYWIKSLRCYAEDLGNTTTIYSLTGCDKKPIWKCRKCGIWEHE